MFRRTVMKAAVALIALAGPPAVAVPAAAAAAPATPAKKLISAWQQRNRPAALKVATPAAVNTLFAAQWRRPDRFAGCVKNVCRFAYTSVDLPGGLDAVLTVVKNGKVAKVYVPRHFTAPGPAARHLFAAWKINDRNRGLEAASAAAVKTVFRVRYSGQNPYTWQGCFREQGGWDCAYSYEGGAMHLHVRGRAASGYWVQYVTYFAD